MMSAPLVVEFESPNATADLVGGKGYNLALLTRAGFPVPQGFCVTTEAYRLAVSRHGVSEQIADKLAGINYANPDELERITRAIRELIVSMPLSEQLACEIRQAYTALGEDGFVAVRSSGTAEDLEGASFAGLHDTYLDIRGADEVADAVKRCWASLWTARATAYRHSRGFEHGEVALSVAVQLMVKSSVSGVMFTANPMTAATDEVTINASWGLGEAIVSGIVTPDEITVKSVTGQILDRMVGEKQQRIDRDPEGGTVTTDVPRADRSRLSLTDAQIAELTRLGLAVQHYYGDIPQDVEWAMAGDQVHLLQSRPITGVDFSWDIDVDGWQQHPEDPDVIWTKAMADEVWTGAVTPLFYSWRAYLWQCAHADLAQIMELPDAQNMWFWKFHRSEAYYNTRVQQRLVEDACPPPFRPLMLGTLPPAVRENAGAAPFSYAGHLRRYLRTSLLHPRRGFHRWTGQFAQLVEKTVAQGRGYLEADLTVLSDLELKRRIDEIIECEGAYYREIWVPFWIFSRDMSGVLAGMVEAWYDGDNPLALVELMTGVPKRTVTMEENHQLWTLAEEIRATPALRDAFNRHQGTEFIEALKGFDEGRAYLARYTKFLYRYGHRGHADRDMYFPRRSEDPLIDYRSITAMLSVANAEDPEAKERAVNARRQAVADDVIASIRTKPFGAVRVELFKTTLEYVLKFLMARDDERTMADMTTLAIKRGFEEVSRRLRCRGVLGDDRDFYFLARHELFALLDRGDTSPKLTAAKITGRKANFDDYLAKRVSLPNYLCRGRAVALDAPAPESADGTLSGTGTSRGVVTGTARVLHGLEDIGRLTEGEILVCHATDPGWTPVFLVISGLVLETGGVLAHGSCLSREYGLPCVQVSGATGLIPDGAVITVNGDAGTVVIDEVPVNATAPAELIQT